MGDGAHEDAAALVRQASAEDGEMVRLVREFDWAAVGMGDPADWPAELRVACRICLNSQYPMVVWWGPQMRCIYNDAYRPLLGGKHPAALGSPGEQVWAEAWPLIEPSMRQVLESGVSIGAQDVPLEVIRQGYREETYWTFSTSPLHGNGAVTGVFTVCDETTEQVVARRRLEALRRLGSLTETPRSVPEACRLAAETLREAERDAPFAALYARKPGGDALELVATSPPGIDPRPRDDGPGGWPLEEVMRTGRPVVVADVAERFGELPSGGWPVPPREAMVLPLPGGEDGRPAGVIVLAAGAGRPLDEGYRTFLRLLGQETSALISRALTYRAQQRRAEELAELNRAKTVFFTDISHEFRTPLTLIVGPLEELRSRLGPADQWVRENLEIIRHSALRMTRLVDTLLDFARIEAGRMEARYQPTDLAVFTADLAGVFRAAVDKAGLRLEVDCPPLPEPVYVDRGMWEKIVLNLLSNALKFTFEGSITVRLRAEDGQAVLRVSDTGVGMSEQDLPRVFERFQRVKAAQTRSIEGSGIGLALVRELVHLHGGTIGVDSTLGKGTTFTIRLPFGHAHLPEGELVPSTEEEVSPTADPYVEEALRWLPGDREDEWTDVSGPAEPHLVGEAVSAGERARVLVADDNADLRDYLRRLLRPAYRVKTVADGEQALRAARADPPDLVISDVMMPGMGGLELVSRLRADPRTADVPVLLLSALAGERHSAEGLAAGADDYLVKPFSAVELLARVRANVEMHRLRRQHAAWRSALFDSLQEAFFVMNEQGEIIEINNAFTDLLGFGPEGLPYRQPFPWWPDPDTEPEAHRRTAELVSRMTRRAKGRHTTPLRHRDGRRVWVATAYNEVFTPGTGERRIVGTLRDITAERAAAQRDMALANMSLRLSGTDSLPQTLRAALEEMAGLWEPARIIAATWDEGDRVQVISGGAEIGWEDLPAPVRATIEDLRRRPPLRPVSFADPAGVGITLEHFGGPLVIWIEPDPHRLLTSEDQPLLIALCGYLSQALQHISVVSQQREIVLAFQRAILSPGELPGGFSARYEPAARPLPVGGDWYDAFGFPDGRIGIVVGDCVGRGVSAAAVMGQLRSACRALLLQLADPALTLAAMDGFAEMVPGAVGTTVFCGVLDPHTGRLTYSSAGHLPGIAVHADARTDLLEEGRGTPLGVVPGMPRPDGEYLLPPETTLLLYTDGLIERRDRSLDVGIGQAAAVARRYRRLPLEDLAQQVMTRLIPEGKGYDDDAALLLYRRPHGLHLSFPADAARLAAVRAELRRWLEGFNLGPALTQRVLTAAGEACGNAVEHGRGDHPGRLVRLTASVTGEELQVTVADSSRWQFPHQGGGQGHGRGLALIRALIHRVAVEHGPTGTTVDMRIGIAP